MGSGAIIDLAGLPRRVLEEVTHQLVALAVSLDTETTDPATLRSAAADVASVASRLRWVADVLDDPQWDLRPCH